MISPESKDTPSASRLVTIKQVTDILNVSKKTVDRLRKTVDFPRPFRVRGSLRWKLAEVLEWIESRPRVD